MKHILSLIFFMIPAISFAIPCPNGSIIYKGNTLDEVIKQCGEPTSRNSYTKTVVTSQEWKYYKPNPNNINTKITILFDHDKVANINIVDGNVPASQACQPFTQLVKGVQVLQANCINREENVTSTLLCGLMIQTHDSAAKVMSICGRPTSKQDLQSYPVSYTEIRYDYQTSSLALLFENDQLIDIK